MDRNSKKIALFFYTLAVLAFFLFSSCAHIKSGHYVQVQRGDSWKSLASLYSTSSGELKAENSGRTLTPGKWVFIPLRRGIAHYINAGAFETPFGNVASNGGGVGMMMWPVPSSRRISSPYGPRWRGHHDGIDISARRGANILAADGGRVAYSGRGISGYGNLIIIHHGGGTHTVYAHNNKNYVSKGDRVHRGQVIGLVGSTGRSTGPHLHFEIRKRKKTVNPVAYLPVKSKYYVAGK